MRESCLVYGYSGILFEVVLLYTFYTRLTLFMTKICVFCYPIYDLTNTSIAILWPLWLTQLFLNISYAELLLTVLLIMMKE